MTTFQPPSGVKPSESHEIDDLFERVNKELESLTERIGGLAGRLQPVMDQKAELAPSDDPDDTQARSPVGNRLVGLTRTIRIQKGMIDLIMDALEV